MAFASAVMSLLPTTMRGNQIIAESTPQRDAPSVGLTQIEKQAMVDDLQLEIAKRARGLRAIYNEQARQLRETLERRIHRIPPRMRTKTMGELADEQTQKAAAIKQAPKLADKSPTTKSVKRSSVTAFGAEDKENGCPELDHQKKRQKPNNAAQALTTKVLSPRSHNSRTIPARPVSPGKSPVKSRLATSVAKPRPVSRAASRQGTTAARKPAAKKSTQEQEEDGRTSESSTASVRTTIVKKTAEAAKKPAARKPTVKASTTTARKRAVPTKPETQAPATTRTLRKRG